VEVTCRYRKKDVKDELVCFEEVHYLFVTRNMKNFIPTFFTVLDQQSV
jgi:hypothetical protein